MEHRAQQAAVARLLNRVFRLVSRVRLVPGNKPLRLVPSLTPADLWRQLPALIREACDLAETMGPDATANADLTVLRCVGDMIDIQPAPVAQ